MTARLTRGAVAGTALALGLTVCSTAAHAATPPARVNVDTAPGWTAGATTLGHTAGSQRVEASVVLTLRNAGAAEALAAAVSDPKSASYGRYVTPAQWRASFAPRDEQLDSVRSWLTASGLTVGEVPANRRYVTVSGTAAQAEKAFGTRLNDFSKAGRRETAPATAITVPASLAGAVAGVAGLDTSAVASPARVDPARDAPATAAGEAVAPADVLPPPGAVFRNAEPCSTYYGEKPAAGYPQILPNPLTYVPCGYEPHQIRGAYGLDAALAVGNGGQGTTVAIVDAYSSPTILQDAQTYAARHDPSHPLLASQFSQIRPANYAHVRPNACDAAGWYGEETLDVEAVHATAPAANILYVGARSCYNADINFAVNRIVDGGLAQVISNSYGSAGEGSFAQVAAEHQTFLQAAAQGISVLFSSGDSGDQKARLGRRTVDSPASDPYVTAVGGTSLAVGRSDAYLFEQGWGTGRAVLMDGAWVPNPPAFQYGSGGGTSRTFKQPGYQQGVVPADIATYFSNAPHRAVPDVAMVGDPNTGMLVGQTQSFPDGSLQYSEYRIGGTSLSSPLFAGVVALAAQRAGHTLGFLNPALYSLAGSAAFRDVDHGRAVTDGVVRVDYTNTVDASEGFTTTLRTLNQTGTIYTRPGYDDVTGLGSPRGSAFLTALAGAR